jgi:hypothetical protein
MKVPLFIYDEMPSAMKRYIKHFGWNFNKKAFQYAVSKMFKEDSNGKRIKIEPKSKEAVEEILKKHGVELKNDELYNATYTYHMVLADYMGISIDDERHAALMVKAIIDDPDNKGGNVFAHWYWDRVHNGEGVDFEDFLDD